MGCNLYAKDRTMNARKKNMHVYEGDDVALVAVALIEDDTSWTPYLGVEDAYKRDGVREALRGGGWESASRFGKIFELRPVVSR
jgi:hypothetical protein